MKTCKKCGYEGEFKFCPDCGTLYVETAEEKMDKLAVVVGELAERVDKIEIVMAMQRTKIEQPVEKKEKTAKRKQKQRKYSINTELWDKRIKKMLAYVRDHPNKVYTVKDMFIKTKVPISGEGYAAVNEELSKGKIYGIKVTASPNGRFKLQASSTPQKKVEPVKVRAKMSPDARRRIGERAKFVCGRSIVLMRAGMARKDAMKQASDEWAERKAAPVATLEKTFPNVPVPIDMAKTLIDKLAGVIAEKGEFKAADAYSIGVVLSTEYVDLMESFMKNQQAILDYFDAKGQFVFLGEGSSMRMVYRE